MDDELDPMYEMPEAAERVWTLCGLLAVAVIIVFAFRHDWFIALFHIHPAVTILAACGVLMLPPLALFGLGSTWRLLTRGRRRQPQGEIDLGWGGALGHAGEADEDAMCGIMGSKEG